MDSSNTKVLPSTEEELSPKDQRNARLIGLLALNASLLKVLHQLVERRDENGMSIYVTQFVNDLIAQGDGSDLDQAIHDLARDLNIRLIVTEVPMSQAVN